MHRFDWKDRTAVEQLIKKSFSLVDAARNAGLSGKGGNYITIKKYIEKYDIDTSHFKTQKELIGGANNTNYQTLKEYLSTPKKIYNNTTIKRKMIEEGYINDECSSCGLASEWNGKPIVLQLDHIDGDSSNNTISNFRLLCPNCHSQTPTFGFKNRKPKRKCVVCDADIMSGSNKTCSRECFSKLNSKNSVRENPKWKNHNLREMIKTMSNTEIALKVGLTETSVRKRRKKLGI